jgi:c-di-GMP-binding flagellar brake protein YcgR
MKSFHLFDQTSGRDSKRAATRRMAEDLEPVRLQINDQIQATIKGTDEEIPTNYLSRVEDIKENDLIIGWPTHLGVRAPVRMGDVLSLFYHSRTAVMAFDARIVGKEQEPIPVLTVRVEGGVRRIQRREYVRVPAMVDVELRSTTVTTVKLEPGVADADFIVTRTINISGGGFAIKHTAHPRVGTEYDVTLKVPDVDKPILGAAKAVRVESFIEADRRVHVCGFAFIRLNESLRRQIISYIFKFQQNSLSKG